MGQIVFYWVGNDISIPTLLLKTIRILYRKDVRVIQISDQLTKKVSGIDEIIRINATGKLMTDRLYGYSKVKTIGRTTLFLDADTLIINVFSFNSYESGIYLAERISNPMINHNHPQNYPEFEGKYFKEVMPYLAGVILISDYENIFNEILGTLHELPKRFHEWYGDQYAMKIFFETSKVKLSLLPEDFVYLLEFDGENTNLKLNLNTNNKVLTFKGSTKKLMYPIFKHLTK